MPFVATEHFVSVRICLRVLIFISDLLINILKRRALILKAFSLLLLMLKHLYYSCASYGVCMMQCVSIWVCARLYVCVCVSFRARVTNLIVRSPYISHSCTITLVFVKSQINLYDVFSVFCLSGHGLAYAKPDQVSLFHSRFGSNSWYYGTYECVYMHNLASRQTAYLMHCFVTR